MSYKAESPEGLPKSTRRWTIAPKGDKTNVNTNFKIRTNGSVRVTNT